MDMLVRPPIPFTKSAGHGRAVDGHAADDGGGGDRRNVIVALIDRWALTTLAVAYPKCMVSYKPKLTH